MTKFERLQNQLKEAKHDARLFMLAFNPTPPAPVEVPYKARKAAYKALVWRLTEAQDLSGVKGIELREFRKYDLDHIISIHDGFLKGIPAEAVASVDNLRIIPHKQNWDKGVKSDYEAHPLGQLLMSRHAA